MMKNLRVKTLLLSVMAAFAFTACQSEFDRDQDEAKAKPGVLSLQLKSSGLKTKATWNGFDTPDGEKFINDFTIFVIENGGNVEIAKYYNSFTDGMTVDIPVTTNAYSIRVVANKGDMTSLLADSASIYGYTLDLSSDPTYGNLLQTGESVITWNGNVPSATVWLKFVPSRISFEEVTLFGLNEGYVTANDTTSMNAANKSAFKTSGIEDIAISSVFILNAPTTTYLFPRPYLTWPQALFTDDDYFYEGAYGFSDGDYYPVSPLFTSYNSFLMENWNNNAIPNGSDYPYFYVWENNDNGTKTSGITLAVIGCDVKILGVTETKYYAIVLDDAINSKVSSGGNTYPDYSTKRGVHYRIKVNIKSIGKVNPYTNPSNLTITLIQTPWDEMEISGEF